MEAVPRLPMMWFPLKSSPEGTSFNNLKKYIAEYYQENPESFSREVFALETLRNAAMHPPKDVTGCATLKRYYCQLHSLANRFPQVLERNLFTFIWKDLYANNATEIVDFRYEMAAVLFNIAAHHTQLGASVNRADADGMKLACTHFQIAAWSYGELREKYQGINSNGDFMIPELLLFMQQVSFAQAQECILEKSLIDNRKPAIVAKVTAQIVSYYGAALAALLTGGDDGIIADVIGNSVLKTWKKYARFKISYLNCILFLYQGQQAEEQQKMGERVTLYQAAFDNLEEARKESKGLENQTEILEALTFTDDVVEAKRRTAKNENEFIYHEAIPELKDISAVQGANLVNGINFSVIDPEIAGEDIFARLIPMKAHEASSMYSEEKANLLRQIGAKVSEKDSELVAFMSSLNIENLNLCEERTNKIPQGIVDRCAAINVKPNAIPNLISSMSSLAEICADVQTNLNEIRELLDREDINEKKFQQESGVHRNNVHLAELSREFQKYMEAHQKAGDSNVTLRRAMELHVNNLRILAKPLQEIQKDVPKLSGEIKEELFQDLKLTLNKVNEMKAQRAQFCAELRIAINDDDITSQIIAFGENNDMKELFKKEIAKHDKLVALIEQNLKAQENILVALTEYYAKSAPILKTINDVKHKRDNFFSSLAASYDVYEDLLAKSAKGLEFYKKLQGNVQKLLARVKAACDVQNEERQQRMNSASRYNTGKTVETNTANKTATPKLKDFLKNSKVSNADSKFVPPIRPSPLGSEAPPSAACVAINPPSYSTQSNTSEMPNDYLPPPYTPPTQQYYSSSGYTNPIYQNNQNSLTSTTKYDSNFSIWEHPSQYQNPLTLYTSIQSAPATMPTSYPITSINNISSKLLPYQYAASDPPVNISNQRSNTLSYTAQTDNGSSQYTNPGSASHVHPHSASFLVIAQRENGSLEYTNPSSTSHVQPHSSSFSSITTHTSQTPAQNSWTPLAAANAFENLAINNSVYQAHIMQNQEYVNAWNPSTASASNIEYLQPQNYVQILTMNNWNTAGSNTLSQSTSQLNSTTASYPAYQNYQMSITQNEQISREQTQNMPLEYVQSHTKKDNYETHSSVNMSNPSTFIPCMAPTITSTRDNASISSAAVQPYVNQTDQSQLEGNRYGSNISNQDHGTESKTDYFAVDNCYQESFVRYPDTAPKAIVSNSGTEQFYNNSGLTHPTKQIQNISQQSTVPQANEVQSSNPTPSINVSTKTKATIKQTTFQKSTNIDLLSDIDFSGSVLTPALQPQLAQEQKLECLTPNAISEPGKMIAENDNVSAELEPINQKDVSPQTLISEQPCIHAETNSSVLGIPQLMKTKSINDISICGFDLSDDQGFESSSVTQSEQTQSNASSTQTRQSTSSEITGELTSNNFDDPKTIKYFHKEVERYEKMMEGLNVKMLNGNTPLVNKWKELQDLLVRDEAKRTTIVARLFPEKNRSTDCIPFDHARVVLEKSTDDYINAAYVKDLGPNCPTFILVQTPLPNTVIDFWSMVWTQKARTVICLHTPNEILDTFWPTEFNKEMHFDDFSVALTKQFELSHCLELNLKMTLNGADTILDLSLIQIKHWTKNSPEQILGIAQNILVAYKQRSQEFKSCAPLIMNCLTGSERCGLIALAICAILATQAKRPFLINAVDVWYRICSQRKSALRDANNLELSLQIILSHGHALLNKRGIMTSYQMKTIKKTKFVEKEVVKDPLNDLDPLWKLKPK